MHLALFLPAIVLTAMSSANASPAEFKAVKPFVSSFYDWYPAAAANYHKGPACRIALKQRPGLFGKQLLKALGDDLAAQAKVREEIVGIDWDPFLWSQDPYEQYRVGQISERAGKYYVDVHSLQDGLLSKTPDVVAIVGNEGNNLVFLDFKNPDGASLLMTLKKLKQSRAK
jgi:hypothetical protein